MIVLEALLTIAPVFLLVVALFVFAAAVRLLHKFVLEQFGS